MVFIVESAAGGAIAHTNVGVREPDDTSDDASDDTYEATEQGVSDGETG